MKLVYFGNKLSKHGKSKSGLETLHPLFSQFCSVSSYSDKKNQYFRLLDMVFHFFIRGLNSDVIMIDVFSTKSFSFAYILARLSSIFNRPYILFLRGGNLPERYDKSKRKVDRIFRKAKAIVAPSGYLKSFFEGKGFSVVLIPNIIDINKIPFHTRRFSSPQLLYIRGFGQIYNPQMTIRAVCELRDEYPDIRLAMLGSDIDGTLSETEQLIVELNLERQVQILGNKTQEEWMKLSKEFNIMVSNPIIDNTPISVIQGMALGLLVISTEVGGVPFLIQHRKDGMLVKSNDHKAMANAIRELLTDSDLSLALLKNARKKAESFSWDNVRPKWENLLNYCTNGIKQEPK